jgi:tRNA threonylcarbamoyladenosine biosynthesis protein TsaE
MIAECSSKEATQTLAGKLAQNIPVGSVVALIGNLGTGKTTFAQGFAKELGITDTVGSPTFKLISEYDGEPHNLYHIDCYRLKNEIDFLNIGGEAFLTQDDGITLIEWADIIKKILPSNVITINFSSLDGYPNSRQIEIIGILDED